MVTEMELFEYADLTWLDFCLWGLAEERIYNRKVDTRDELLTRILDAAARIKKREDQLRWTTHDLRTRVAKCIEFDSEIFEYLLRIVTNLSFPCDKFLSIILK
jgi:hypothetical protein